MPNNPDTPRKRPFAAKVARGVRRNLPLMALDLAAVMASYLMALALRFEGAVPAAYWRNFWVFVPFAIFSYLYLNWAFGLYGEIWRYASVREARRVVVSGGIAASFLIVASEIFGGGGRVLPLSVTTLGAAFSLLGLGAIRFQSRLFALRRRTSADERTRILLVGAGGGGAMVLRDILRHPELGMEPVAVVDDDPRKVGRSLLGVPVLGTRAAVPSLVERLDVDQVLVAIPTATGELVREVVALVEHADVDVRVLPSVREIVNNRVTVRDIRDVRLEDLLGRQLVETDLAAVRSLLRGRRLLITGAGGSIGSEIVRQVLEFEPSRVVLLDRDEIHLDDLLGTLGEAAGVEVVLGDIRDRAHMHAVLKRARPDVVFHAAAHKHLPILERHPREAVLTNVLGTMILAQASVEAAVERFVLISTDKAVRPSSVMGMSKWLAEQVVWSQQGAGCAFSAVRFGNVLGSRGGVVQTFLRQVAEGGPVTVTDPEMSRYFMSIPESVQLVLQAAALSRGGEVFTLEMGEPVRIVDLAHEVVRLAGRIPGRDVKIEVVGRRPGEKLVEDLLDPAERPEPSEHPDIMVSRPAVPDREALMGLLRDLERLARDNRTDELAATLRAASALLPGRSPAGQRIP